MSDPNSLDATTPRAVLLTVPNHHRRTDGGKNYPPEFDADEDFVAYMPNPFGEQMVFVRKRGADHGILYHGDLAWQPAEVRLEGRVAQCPGIILGSEEITFLTACMASSAACFGINSTA